MNYSPVWTMKKNKKALQLSRENEIKEKAAHYPCILCINFRSFCYVFQGDINKYTATTTLTNYPQLPWFAVLLVIRTLSFIILTPWLQKIISNALNKCGSWRVRCFDLKGKIPFTSTIADLRSQLCDCLAQMTRLYPPFLGGQLAKLMARAWLFTYLFIYWLWLIYLHFRHLLLKATLFTNFLKSYKSVL